MGKINFIFARVAASITPVSCAGTFQVPKSLRCMRESLRQVACVALFTSQVHTAVMAERTHAGQVVAKQQDRARKQGRQVPR
jgi:hypothetical protein